MFEMEEEVNRDVRCAQDVKVMAELGRFGEEFCLFGTAIRENGQVYYYATADEKRLREYMHREKMEGREFVPVKCLTKRSKVPAGMRDSIIRNYKLELMRDLQADYEYSGFLEAMEPLMNTRANDAAKTMLEEYWESIRGYYNDWMHQLYLGLLDWAMDAKVLQPATYRTLYGYYEKEHNQMKDDPIVEDTITRTFYGFVYRDAEGKRMTACDALEMPMVRRREEMIAKGMQVGGMLQKTCRFAYSYEMPKLRDRFREELLKWEDDRYFAVLQQLKDCDGVIDGAQLEAVEDKIKQSPRALETLQYYKHLWNVKNPR